MQRGETWKGGEAASLVRFVFLSMSGNPADLANGESQCTSYIARQDGTGPRGAYVEQHVEYADEIDLREYIELLWRGKWVIVIVTLCAMLSAAGVSFFVLDPVYESSTVLTISLPEEVQASLEDPVIAGIIGGTPQAHIRLLQDPVILERVAGSLGTPLTAAALAGKVTAKAVGDAAKGDRLVEITVRDPVPENAQALAKAIVEAYRDYLSELVSTRLSSRRQLIAAELASQEAATSEKIEKLKQLVEESGGTNLLTQEINARTAALANYRWEFAQLTSEARAASESLKVLEQQLAAIPQTVPLEWSSRTRPDTTQSPETGVFTTAQINPAYTSLLEEVSRKRADLADLRARLDAARDAIPVLETEISELKARLVKQAAIEERLEDELNTAKSRLIDLAGKLQNLEGRDARAIVRSAIGVVAPATLPAEPSGPRKLLNIAIAGVLGVMVSVFVVFIMHYWRSTQPMPAPQQPMAGRQT